MTSGSAMTFGVCVVVPSVLTELSGGARQLRLDLQPGSTVAGMLDVLATSHPLLARRIRDETGQIRRYVNVYVDGDDVRDTGGVATALPAGALVHVMPAVAGG